MLGQRNLCYFDRSTVAYFGEGFDRTAKHLFPHVQLGGIATKSGHAARMKILLAVHGAMLPEAIKFGLLDWTIAETEAVS